MSAIKAVVRNGRLETEQPLDWPEGTRVIVRPSEDAAEAGAEANDDDDFWDDTPEGIADWVARLNALEPLELTDEDRRTIESARADQRAWELAHFNERADKLKAMFE